MNLLIAVPTYENIMPECFKAIYDLNCANECANFAFITGYDCARARNNIAQKALNDGYDYVLMIDSDIVVPQNTIEFFMEDPVDICLGIYPKKNVAGIAELFKLGTKDFTDTYSYDELKEQGERIEVKGGGAGCMLVNTDVFKKLKYPWFKYVIYDSGALLSEDLYFMNEASKNGYKIWADTRVLCGHGCKFFKWC